MTGPNPIHRHLYGLDLARYLAFFAMVLVNFKIAMGASGDGSALSIFVDSLEGRAAATFVVLAGIGLGLTRPQSYTSALYAISKKASLLFILGILNSFIFEADIIHYYAFYFLIAAFLLPLSNRWLVLALLVVNLIFLILIFLLDFDQGWNWQTYSYADFWTMEGFFRNLFFNGWHPVFPWVGFVFFGIILARLPLHTVTLQNRLIWAGMGLSVLIEGTSHLLMPLFAQIDPELALLVSTKPVPPLPLYTLAGIGVACFLIGLCLRVAPWLNKIGFFRFIAPAGRQTLTLYFAHILGGMGVLEALDMLGGQTTDQAVIAAVLFCTLATGFSFFWAKRFKHGPMEGLLKWIGR